ncbi:DNA replication/repair protein RecF [Geobacter sp. DSM 9736]|uniref:DNA replication/repair protein RecF n=1 Tax=Geobacter sp. DSM 9736 TaxID=1277350 RepID=UPI000B50EE2A|nr:DNA replication/repair protein RecF [Geobacter sp. DSM 9736]
MKLIKLHVRGFRNLEESTLSFGSRFNIFHGNNAQGKTNLLEAIFILGTMKSFRLAKNQDLIGWDQASSLISGSVEKDCVSREITLLIERQGKKVRVDRKAVSRLSDFFGSLNVVVFSPEDLAMIKAAPETRRRYLDRAVFSSDLTYLRHFHEYGKLLRHRNSLLRSGDTGSLDIWSRKLVETGAKIITSRLTYIEAINPLVSGFYRQIAGKDESAEIAYQPHCLDRDRLVPDPEAHFSERLLAREREELQRGTTVIGPHRDDLEFLLDGKLLRVHASQGQQRTFVLALKMAEIEYLRTKFTFPPVLLLDDMTSELDKDRNGNLMEFLESRQMQVFITTTTLQNIKLHDIEKYPSFHIEAGRVVDARQ